MSCLGSRSAFGSHGKRVSSAVLGGRKRAHGSQDDDFQEKGGPSYSLIRITPHRTRDVPSGPVLSLPTQNPPKSYLLVLSCCRKINSFTLNTGARRRGASRFMWTKQCPRCGLRGPVDLCLARQTSVSGSQTLFLFQTDGHGFCCGFSA
jgi:hypothetical protein